MAIDHRANLLEKLNQFSEQPLSDEAFANFKQEIIRGLAPHSSAVLTDPAYGIARAVANQAITGRLGLLAPLEVTDYALHPSQRSLQFIPDWSVEKVKRAGGDGVKLLLPYHPRAKNVDRTHRILQNIVDDCVRSDIPFFLEPIPYSLDPDKMLSNVERLQITTEMCSTFSQLGVDVLKLSFPVDHKQSHDLGEWQEACEAVNEACTIPWALLSAGVTFDTFVKQVEIACKAGASGVIVGRAVWAEAVELHGNARTSFIDGTATARMNKLDELCRSYAHPWYQTVQIPNTDIDWYTSN